jgi:nicotinate-nucleotide adenylyltransferase
MNIGLFFGSFNPVHTGHLIIANYMADYTGLDEIWLVVSPQNPFKINDELLDEKARFELLNLAIQDDIRFKAIDIEFHLARPSYTVDTLSHLRELHPEHEFTLIIGGDNLQNFHKWKDYQEILKQHKVFVYARVGIVEKPLLSNNPQIKLFEVPLLNISSTYIRESIQAGKSIRYLIPEPVRILINERNYYQDKDNY